MNKDRVYFISKILIIIILIAVYYIFIGIPEYKKSIGSSDKIISTKNYYDMIEIQLNDLDFALVIDKNRTINHIFFFTESAICLYNKNIENKEITEGLTDIVKILIEKDILKNNSFMQITTYENKALADFKQSLSIITNKYSLSPNIVYNRKELIDKVQELALEKEENLLLTLEIYSKNIVNDYDEEDILTEENSLDYAYNVYLKIEKYYLANKDTSLDISLIPANSKGNIFPNKESYYRIENDKIYAYIKIENYDYCFQGSIDNYKKGVC